LRTAGKEYKKGQIELPVNPITIFNPSRLAVSPVLIISAAALDGFLQHSHHPKCKLAELLYDEGRGYRKRLTNKMCRIARFLNHAFQ